MAAQVNSMTNEDGIIEPQIECTPMDPTEYEQRLARVQLRVDPSVVTALSTIGAILDEATVRVHAVPPPPCDICGGDAHWKATSWTMCYEVMLCNQHQQSQQDKYQSFERI